MRRLILLLPALLLVNMLGFGYALLAQRAQGESSPFRAPADQSIPAEIAAHAARVLSGDFGAMPQNQGPVLAFAGAALARSLLVLALAFVISAGAGVAIGMASTRIGPPRIAPWLMPLAVLTSSTPAFYAGVLLSAGLIAASFNAIPLQSHWLLPALVLALRPTLQLAQITANLIAGEADKQYVVAARGIGHTLASARRAHIMPNVAAPMAQNLAASFRLLIAELIVIEWLFNWPGLGRLLSYALIVPRRTDTFAPFFLHPETIAAAFTALALLFLLADVAAGVVARAADPRLRRAARDRAEAPA